MFYELIFILLLLRQQCFQVQYGIKSDDALPAHLSHK